MEIRKIESKYRKLLGQQALEKLKMYIPMERSLFSQHNKEVNELIEIISKGLNEDQHSQPTLEECIKEWEEKGFEVENNNKSISFRNTKLNIDIYADKISKEIQICACHYNYAQTISFEFHNLLSKTLKTLEVKDE